MEDLNQLRPEQESGAKKPAPDDVDALLQDVKSLLGETDADIAAEAPAEPDAEDSEPITADDVQIDYGKFYGPEEPGQSKIPLTTSSPSPPTSVPAAPNTSASASRNASPAPSASRRSAATIPPASGRPAPAKNTKNPAKTPRNTPNGSIPRA